MALPALYSTHINLKKCNNPYKGFYYNNYMNYLSFDLLIRSYINIIYLIMCNGKTPYYVRIHTFDNNIRLAQKNWSDMFCKLYNNQTSNRLVFNFIKYNLEYLNDKTIEIKKLNKTRHKLFYLFERIFGYIDNKNIKLKFVYTNTKGKFIVETRKK